LAFAVLAEAIFLFSRDSVSEELSLQNIQVLTVVRDEKLLPAFLKIFLRTLGKEEDIQYSNIIKSRA